LLGRTNGRPLKFTERADSGVCSSGNLSDLLPRAGSESRAAADYLCEPPRAIFAMCRFLHRRCQRYEFEIRRPEPPHPAWTGKGFPCRHQQMLGGTPGVVGAIEIERWRGLAALDRPGPLQDNRGKCSAPRRSRPMAVGSSTVLFFSNEGAERQRANHDRLHASHGVEVSARRIR
jgi:hypothetical protein